MARGVNAVIYGASEDWDNLIAGQPDYGKVTWHNTHWIYNPTNGTGQEYDTPPDNSIALWGVDSKFAASAKAISYINFWKTNGVITLENCDTRVLESPEASTPLIAYIGHGYSYGGPQEPYKQWITPCAQWAYDVETYNTALAEARLPDNESCISSIPGNSRAIACLDRRNFVAVPTVSYFRRNPSEQGTLEKRSNDSTLSEMPEILAQGWTPCSIHFNLFYQGKIVPDENNPRQEMGMVTVYTQGGGSFEGWLASDTLNDMELPEGLHDFYKTQNIYDLTPSRRIMSGDSSPRYTQAPFTAFGVVGGVNRPGLQGTTIGIQHRGTEIGCYARITPSSYISQDDDFNAKYQLNIHFPDINKEFDFDDVRYKWEYDVYDQVTGLPVVLGDYAEGTDITSHDIVFMTHIQILDTKGNTEAQAMANAVRHECATVGWWFADNRAHAEAIATGSTSTGVGMYLPILDDGITTGLYVTGDDIADNEQADIGNTLDIDYDTTPAGEIVPDGRSGDWSYNYNNYTISSHKYFLLNDTKYNSVRTVFAATAGDNTLDYNGINVGEWMTTLMWYPINPPQRAQTNVNAGPVYLTDAPRWDENVASNTYELGEYSIDEGTIVYPDFRGYNMTKCFLRLPFYGDFELDLHRYWGGKFRVKAFIDFSAGQGTYYIEAQKSRDYALDWFLFDTVDFKIGYALPLNSIAMGTYQNQMHALEKQLLTQKVVLAGAAATTMFGLGLGASIPLGMIADESVQQVRSMATKSVLGGVAGGVGSISKIMDTKYALEHTAPSPGKCLPASPYTALPQDLSCRIIFCYPKCATGYGGNDTTKMVDYGKSVGFACIKQGKLSSLGLHGLTVISNARFNDATGTATEAGLLAQALSAGIIL